MTALDPGTRLLRWLRREVNRDLARHRRELKSVPAGCEAPDLRDRIADCHAKRELIRWAESWNERSAASAWDYADRPDVKAAMTGKLEMIMHAVRYVAGGYRHRAGYREEWDHAR